MDKLQKLYDVLVREGKYTKSFEEFQAKWSQDQAYKDKVYDVVSRDGLYTKDRESFFQTYSAQAPVKTTATTPKTAKPMANETEAIVQPEKKKGSVSGVSDGFSVYQEPKEITEEEDYFTGSFGNVLRGFDKIVPIGLGDFVDDMARSVASGYRQGSAAEEADRLLLQGTKPTDEQIKKFISAKKNAESIGPSAEMKDYQRIYEQEGKGFWGVIKGLANNPSIIPEVMASSLTAMATNTDALTAGGAAISTGAGIGAAAGAPAGGVGAIPGAVGGAITAVPYAFGLASSVVEMGSTFGELLTEQLDGKEMTKENVRAILENPEKLNSIRNKAIARGVIIGTVDAMTGKLASGVGAKILSKSAAKSATGAATKGATVKATAAGSAIESFGGSAGEATARAAIGQEMDISEIALEGLAELPGGIRSTIQARLAKPTYKVNGENVSAQQVDELINTMSPADLAKTKIEIKNDYEGREFKMQDKIVTDAIKQQVKQANPELNEPSLNAITQLEKQLTLLEGNKTQTGKDKAAAIRQQIKNIQENQLQEEAVTETVTAEDSELTKKRTDRISEIENTLRLNEENSNVEGGLTLPTELKTKLETELQTLISEQDAIQEQTAGQVPVQSETIVSETLEGGEPQAGPQVTSTQVTEEQIIQSANQKTEGVNISLDTLETYQPYSELVEITDNDKNKYKGYNVLSSIESDVSGQGLGTKAILKEVIKSEKGLIAIDADSQPEVKRIFEKLGGRKEGEFLIIDNNILDNYKKSKEDNSNPELVKAVDDLLGKTTPVTKATVSSKTQEVGKKAPKLVRDISTLITPATVREFSPLTKRIKALSIKYDKLVKQYSKKKNAKTLAKIKDAEAQILNDAKQEIIDAVAKVPGVSVKFSEDKRGLWDGSFEPSFNMSLSISEQADTGKVSDLLFDFAEKYSQDAFILEADSEYEADVLNNNRAVPLTEFDENGLMHYPQIIYTFDEQLTDEQLADLSVELQNNGVDAFNINKNELKISVIKFFPEDTQLDEQQQYEERQRDLDTKTDATEQSTINVLGTSVTYNPTIRIKKSSYQGAKNEGTTDQTREYDRGDVLEPFKKSTTEIEKLAVELADLRQKEIELQKQGNQLSPEDKARFDELNSKVQPVVEQTFETNKKLYEDAKEEVEGIANEAIAGMKASISPFPIKRPARASVKTIRWYNAFTEKLGDGARVNIVVENDADADKVFQAINEKYPQVGELRRISETTELGYPKRLIEVTASNGVIAEIQVITNEAYLAKDGLSGFTGDAAQKEAAKNKLQEVRSRLGWNIPDGLGHYFYEIQRDFNVNEDLRDEAARLSDLYYDAFTNPNSNLEESFMSDVLAFKNEVDVADKTNWDKGNEGKAPASLESYKPKRAVEPEVSPTVQQEEQFQPIDISDVKIDLFKKDNALDFEENEREGDNGRSYTYISSITVEALNSDGDTIGNITKLADEDGTLSFEVEDINGNQVTKKDGFDTLREAKQALADSWNKIQKKEFDREAKAKAKIKEKETVKAAKAKAKAETKKPAKTVVSETIDDLLDLDVTDQDNLDKIFNALDNADKSIGKILKKGANEAMLAIPLGTVQVVIKAIKGLVKGGMLLRDAIKKVSADNSISQDTIKDIINIAPVQESFYALMEKADALIARQKKRGITDAKIVSNLDVFIRNSEAYKNANDAQKKIMEREARIKMGAAPKRAVSIGRVLGALKDITNISRAEKMLIIKQIRDLSRDASKQLAKELRDMASGGRITAMQAANIVARFGKVNMLNELSVSKFVDYMGKIFANAEYASNLKQANGLRKDIKKLSRNKDKNANLRDLAQQFSKIEPSMVDDIDAYNDMASKIKEAIKGSTIRGQKVKFADTVNIENATEYINKIIDAQSETIRQEKAAEIQELMGVDVSDLSYEQMMMFLDSDETITKYNEGIIRSTMQKMFDTYSSLIDTTLETGKDPFTDEDVDFTSTQKSLIKRFMDMDLTLLKPKEALQAIDALANFFENKSTAKMETVLMEYTGANNLKGLVKKGIVAQPLKKYWSERIGLLLGEQFTNLNILFERMFKGFNRGGMVEDASGVTKLKNNKSMAERESNNIVDRYVSEFYNKKANGEAYNSEYNSVERGLASFMMRNIIGTESEMKAEFDRRKRLVKESIKVLSDGNDKEKSKAELYQEAYDKIIAEKKGVNKNQILENESSNIDDIKRRTDKTNLEGIEFWQNQWSDKYDELSDVSLNIYNKILDKDINYTPDNFVKLSAETGVVDLGNNDSAFHTNNGTIYKKETGVLMTATKPKELPKNPKNQEASMYIDLSFDKNNSRAMYDALVDMKTAAPIRQIEGFLNSADLKKLIPKESNRTLLKQRINLYVSNIRNKNPFSNDELSSTVRSLNRVASVGVGQALGGLLQPVKQVVPAAMNTLINAGNLDMGAMFNSAKNGFINRSGYAISNRGIESQAQVESLNKLIDEASKSKVEQLIKGIEKLNKWWLENFLVKPDIFIARASWMTYYEQSLKKQGINPNGIDYNTHEVNNEAADYAQRMVDRQQNISDVDLAGKLFSSKEASAQLFIKMIMPFASFRMNQSARLGSDLAVLTDKTATLEDKKIAAQSLGGFAVEMATFRAISAYSAILLGSAAIRAMGQEEEEKEKEKRVNNVIKGQVTSSFNDVISPLPLLDKAFQKGGNFLTESMLDIPRESVFSIYDVPKQEAIQNFGLLGITADRALQLYEISDLSISGEYTDDFGNKKQISEQNREALSYMIAPAILSNFGLAPVEANSIVRNSIKYSKKTGKSPQEVADKEKRAFEREQNINEKVSALRELKKKTKNEAELKAISKKIAELKASPERKEQIEEANKREDAKKRRLLYDSNTGTRYDNETDLKRYNRRLYDKNFGPQSEWYKKHKDEKIVDKKMNQEIRKVEDKEYGFSRSKRNSDGTLKRFSRKKKKD
jgi:hypothetical protein